MKNCLINGIAAEYIPLQDRGLQYGDGLFETIACEQARLQFWTAHYQRLRRGAEKLGITCPAEDNWLDDIKNLLTHKPNEQADSQTQTDRTGVIKLTLTRGCTQRGYYVPQKTAEKPSPTRIVQFTAGLPVRYFTATGGSVERQLNTGQEAAVLCVCKQAVSINPSLAGLKHLNRLENVLARNEWQHEYSEGLMQDAGNNVIEGTMSNLFAIKDRQLFTPSLEQSGVDGILRQQVLLIAQSLALTVKIQKLSLTDIAAMDEIFICNSLLEILPVAQIRSPGINWQPPSSGVYPVAAEINHLLQTIKEKHAKII